MSAYEAARVTPSTARRLVVAAAGHADGWECHLPLPGRERHLSGLTASVELAEIGRRVATPSGDVLDLMEGGGPDRNERCMDGPTAAESSPRSPIPRQTKSGPNRGKVNSTPGRRQCGLNRRAESDRTTRPAE